MSEDQLQPGEVEILSPPKVVYPGYRPWLFVAFLFCFVWLLLLAFGLADKLPLPAELKATICFLIPLLVAGAILRPTDLYREQRRGGRLFNLFGVSLALLICAGALLFLCILILFFAGGVSP